MLLEKKEFFIVMWIAGLLIIVFDFFYGKTRFAIDTGLVLLFLILLTYGYFKLKSIKSKNK